MFFFFLCAWWFVTAYTLCTSIIYCVGGRDREKCMGICCFSKFGSGYCQCQSVCKVYSHKRKIWGIFCERNNRHPLPPLYDPSIMNIKWCVFFSLSSLALVPSFLGLWCVFNTQRYRTIRIKMNFIPLCEFLCTCAVYWVMFDRKSCTEILKTMYMPIVVCVICLLSYSGSDSEQKLCSNNTFNIVWVKSSHKTARWQCMSEIITKNCTPWWIDINWYFCNFIMKIRYEKA